MKKTIGLSLITAIAVHAAAPAVLEEIEVKEKADINVTQNIASAPTDTAKLLEKTAGVSFYTAGGISSLPVIHGMADDRVKTSIDGMQITSACPNHMNPALSYVDPTKVEEIKAVAGITPVSEGGDSIGGSIIVKTKKPQFGTSDKMELQNGELSAFYKSNGHNEGASATFTVANDKLSFSYSGMTEKANDYKDGYGDKVRATLYKRNDQSATLAYKLDDENVVSLRVGHQEVPYEGFVNQYMDMLDNKATNINLSYEGKIGTAEVEANVFHQNTSHYMNKIPTERDGDMPMYTKAKESGYNIVATIPVNDVHTLKVGSNYDRYRLDDWWPSPSGTLGGMGPDTFWNINGGKRDRFGLFAEAISNWSDKLSSNIGIRTDIVKMNTGDVVGYNTVYPTDPSTSMMSNDPIDADIFNALDHKRTDHNIDFTAMLQYENSPSDDYEIGFAHKTRSPNLYERYTWAGLDKAINDGFINNPIMMDMAMINWFGDGNGYVGNIDLKPEIADTISISAAFHGYGENVWNVKITPYYTKVKDYIDAELIAVGPLASKWPGIQFLQFVNTDATLYGVDISGDTVLWNNESFGLGRVSGTLTYTKGYRDDGGSLYHIMPLNASITLEQTIGSWTNGIDLTTVSKKDKVDDIRKEPATSGYLLVDIRTNYKVSKNLSVDLAVTNLFDKAYTLPLGGVNVVGVNDEDYAKGSYIPLTGMGRSANIALNYKF